MNRILGALAAEPMQNASSQSQQPSTSVIATWRPGSSASVVVPSATAAWCTASLLRASAAFDSSGATPTPTRTPSPYSPSATADGSSVGTQPGPSVPVVVQPTTGAPSARSVLASTCGSSR